MALQIGQEGRQEYRELRGKYRMARDMAREIVLTHAVLRQVNR